jgi:hypothetical protein
MRFLDVDSVLELLHRVAVEDIATVSEAHAASIFWVNCGWLVDVFSILFLKINRGRLVWGASFKTKHQCPLYPLPQFHSKSRMLYLHSKHTEQLTNVHTSTLKKKEACISETSATTRRTTWCNNPRTELTNNYPQ